MMTIKVVSINFVCYKYYIDMKNILNSYFNINIFDFERCEEYIGITICFYMSVSKFFITRPSKHFMHIYFLVVSKKDLFRFSN